MIRIASGRARFATLTLLASLAFARPATGSDCTNTSVGFAPLNDLGTGLYLGQFQGGLYPGGLNIPPPAHRNAGTPLAAAVRPLNTAGTPAPNGRYALLSIGMSNTTQEFCCGPWTFSGQAAVDPRVNHTSLAIVNGAAGGQTAMTWDSPTDANYDRVRDQVLAPRGLSELQVQAVWIKEADAGPSSSLPGANADANILEGLLGSISRAVKVRYPNVKLIFLSSRIYAGYASTALNPEPYAYESGFSVKWLVEAQIDQMAGGGVDPIAGDMNPNTVSAFVAWGPYLWADGLTPRSDGLTWACADLENDGTHPSQSGEQKVASQLLSFMLDSPFSRPWFRVRVPGCESDLNNDGQINLLDLTRLLANYGETGATAAEGDIDNDGDVDLNDLAHILADFGQPCP